MTAPSQIGRPWLDHAIVDGAYTGRLNALATEVIDTFDGEEKGQLRLAETRKSLEMADDYDALAKEAERTVRVMALRRRRWAEVKAQHPPRMVNGENHTDDVIGVNTTTFFDAVMAESIIDPDGDMYDPKPLYSAAECEAFTEELSNAEWNGLCSVVWVLNERGVGVPKSSMASQLRQRIGDSSEPPETSGSPRLASPGGNRLAAASTTTPTGT